MSNVATRLPKNIRRRLRDEFRRTYGPGNTFTRRQNDHLRAQGKLPPENEEPFMLAIEFKRRKHHGSYKYRMEYQRRCLRELETTVKKTLKALRENDVAQCKSLKMEFERHGISLVSWLV